MSVYAFAPEEDVAPVNNPALLGVLARARARTALSVHDLNTNARAKKQSRRHPWLMPTSGNHDYDILYRVAGRLPYHQYFPHLDLMPPGGALSNGMFYSIVLGRAVDDDAPLLEIFVINSNLGHQHHRADTLAFNVQVSVYAHKYMEKLGFLARILFGGDSSISSFSYKPFAGIQLIRRYGSLSSLPSSYPS